MKTIFAIYILGAIILPAANPRTASADSSTRAVVPISWTRFKEYIANSDDMKQSRQILANAVRYNLAWMGKAFKVDNQRGLYRIMHFDEQGIRPSASACYGAAVALRCADLEDKALGMPREEAFRRVAMLIKGVAAVYKTNNSDGKGWGNGWQSALWATLVGQGGWMLWNILDPETRKMVQLVVEDEADRFIAPGYKVPYWKAPDGHINTPGDTKAEENAWNATILQLAMAMMPSHPHVKKWEHVCTELMLSAYALKKDLHSEVVVAGHPVSYWLHGFNVRDDGGVVNHHIIHPDYTIDITINARSFLTQPLAGEPVWRASEWNAQFIYRSLVEHVWPSPPYKAPGGTMYILGKGEVYYPQGTDWSKFRFAIYYLNDVDAHLLGWDKGLRHPASCWMRIRASRILAMQARHADGHMFAPGERPHNPGREQMVIWQAADAYLLFWLHVRHSIRFNPKSPLHRLMSVPDRSLPTTNGNRLNLCRIK